MGGVLARMKGAMIGIQYRVASRMARIHPGMDSTLMDATQDGMHHRIHGWIDTVKCGMEGIQNRMVSPCMRDVQDGMNQRLLPWVAAMQYSMEPIQLGMDLGVEGIQKSMNAGIRCRIRTV